MNELNEPAMPEELNPTPHPTIAGDWSDDDGQVIDESFEAMDVGPQDYNGVMVDQQYIPINTRIMSRVIPIGPGMEPIQLFPDDGLRRRIRVMPNPVKAYHRVPNPGMGSAALFSPPSGEVWHIDEYAMSVVTGTGLGTRFPQFRILSGSTIVDRGHIHQGVPPSGANDFGNSMNLLANNYPVAMPITLAPPLRIEFGLGGLNPLEDEIKNIWVRRTEYDCYWRIASDKSSLYNGVNLPGTETIDWDYHTGAMWVYAPDASTNFTIRVWSVTE